MNRDRGRGSFRNMARNHLSGDWPVRCREGLVNIFRDAGKTVFIRSNAVQPSP